MPLDCFRTHDSLRGLSGIYDMYVYMYMYTHTCILMYMHTHINMYMYTHTHTHRFWHAGDDDE